MTPHLVANKDLFHRPTAMAFGAGAAMYVLDFSSPVIENSASLKRDPGRVHSRGRVWRITYATNPLLQPFAILDRPSRPLRYRQDRIDNAIDRMAQQVENEHIRVCPGALLACWSSSSGSAPAVAQQASRDPMDLGMQKALDDTMDVLERPGSIRP